MIYNELFSAATAREITKESIKRKEETYKIFDTIDRFARSGLYSVEVYYYIDTDIQSFLRSLGYKVQASEKTTTISWND